MSLRYLYRKVPTSKRICYACGDPILRNIALGPDGELYHYGCLMEEKAKTFRCHACFSTMNGLETRWTELNGKRVRACGNCGNPNLVTGWEAHRL